MSDKKREQQVYAAQKQKYLGLGDENTTSEEWLTNVHRDVYHSLASHSGLLEYVSLGMNSESKRETRVYLINKMCETKTRSDERNG